MSLYMEYSAERDTWNVVDADTSEWIFEGTYDQCEKIIESNYED